MPLNPYIGQIMPVAFNVIPRGWHLCDGSLVAVQQNQALFSLIGTTYGGNGTTNFALPDLRGRAILGASGTTGGLYPPGLQAGTTTVPLTTSQIPQHNHMIQASTTQGVGRGDLPTNKIFGTNTDTAVPAIFATAGSAEVALAVSTNVVPNSGGLPHNNVQPYLAINYMIATVGVYPSRN